MSEVILEARHIDRFFGEGLNELKVLQDLNFSLSSSETVAIVGQSGSGKSTLLSLLAGLDQPSSGEIILRGNDITRMSEKVLAQYRSRNIGIVFQQFHLMNQLTALENISLPLEIAGVPVGESNKRSTEILGQVGLTNRGNHYPHQLSGGEKQRVALARALVIDPPILLADEPSGSLDQKTGDQVMKLLFDLIQQKKHSLILVTHNESLARQCSRLLHLQDGKLVEDTKVQPLGSRL
jgi:putative ABC transport system ATP-binding protein